MSQTTSLELQPGRTNKKLILGGQLATDTLNALSDELSRRIITSVVSERKTVLEICLEQALPLSSCYRRARELVAQGLLLVDSIVLTAEGKRHSVYRASFKSVEMVSDFRETSVSVELNEDMAERFRRKWLSALYPN